MRGPFSIYFYKVQYFFGGSRTSVRCLEITEKVSFNIASEASYVNILSGQKLINNGQKWSILASFWKPKACGQAEF